MLSYGTDLMVLGSRGYGIVRRVLAGAAAYRVEREAACPVVVAPRSAREHAPELLVAAGA
jgi:nucleotide-binding universal stress UspA family protein